MGTWWRITDVYHRILLAGKVLNKVNYLVGFGIPLLFGLGVLLFFLILYLGGLYA